MITMVSRNNFSKNAFNSCGGHITEIEDEPDLASIALDTKDLIQRLGKVQKDLEKFSGDARK
jgi:hypothetical protein